MSGLRGPRWARGVLACSGGIMRRRWWILAAAFVAQVPNGNLQYTWTLYTHSLVRAGPWPLGSVQVAFFLFVLLGSLFLPLNGWLVDRFGPRRVALLGGVLIGLSWVGASRVHSLITLYISYGVLGGVGSGMIYAAALATALKWFPDHRGLCAGVVVAGYQTGPVLLAAPIAATILHAGFRRAFFEFGIIQALIVIVAALFLSVPLEEGLRALKPVMRAISGCVGTGADTSPARMVRTPQFWLMYGMFICTVSGGLMTAAQLEPIATFHHADRSVILGGLATLVVALQLSPLLSGVSWPLWGWISDRLGREQAMGIAFALEGIALMAFPAVAARPLGFLVASGLVFFFWVPWALFPALVADLYGKRFAATNYGILYTAKGVGAFWAGPVAASVYASQQRWDGVFYVAAAANFTAAALAFLVLRQLAPTWTQIPVTAAEG